MFFDIEYEIDENKYFKFRVVVKDNMNFLIDLDVDFDVKIVGLEKVKE